MGRSFIQKAAFDRDWQLGWAAFEAENFTLAKQHFERAHYAGVFSLHRHALAHYAQCRVAVKQSAFLSASLQIVFLAFASLSPITYVFYRIGFFLPIKPNTKEMFEREFHLGLQAFRIRDFDLALYHLGRAHILGNHFAFFHLRVHFVMMMIEIKRGRPLGIWIQGLRTIGALFTRFLVHFFGVTGNPGATEYPIGTRLPLHDDIKKHLEQNPIGAD